jgi:hypothetical protein
LAIWGNTQISISCQEHGATMEEAIVATPQARSGCSVWFGVCLTPSGCVASLVFVATLSSVTTYVDFCLEDREMQLLT